MKLFYRCILIAAGLVVVSLSALTAAHGSAIEGCVILEGETNHAGTRVEVFRYPLGAYCDETYTDASGCFSIWVPGASCYDVIFSHPGFVSDGQAYTCVGLLDTVTLPDDTLYRVDCEELNWHHYPWVPPGTDFVFPEEEGRHTPITTYPIEWWYVNFHLTGESTGREYGAFVAFFKIPPMRLFSISDLHQEQTYTDAQCVGLLTADDSKLDLRYIDQIGQADIWHNMDFCTGGLHPYTYRLHVDATAAEDGNPMELDVIMSSTKAPMIVGGDGVVHVGDDSSHYYSHTKIDVLDDSEISVHGRTEKVSGYAWIDHQWGGIPLDDLLTWEWFSIKLDDSTEIMVADAWINGELAPRHHSRFNLFDADCALHLSDEYTITPLRSWQDPHSGLVFATKWRIQEPLNDVNLIVTAEYEDQVMDLPDGCDYPYPYFWEGVCSVSGSIEGTPVSGKAYAELTHYFPDGPCQHVGTCSDDISLYWHEENPPSYSYTAETEDVRGGEGGTYLSQDCIFILTEMRAEETRCHQTPVGWMCGTNISYFGLILCIDPSTGDTSFTIRLPEYGSLMPQAEYYGLAYNQADNTFWYCRPIQPLTVPPSPPRTTIYHIDASGNEISSFIVVGHFIVGLAFDEDDYHLWLASQGNSDMLLEYDVSSGEPELVQGPFEVPWSSENGAAGLDYDEEENALVAVDASAKRLLYFCDTDPGYPGPPGPGEPRVAPIDSCTFLWDTPWGVALSKSTESVFITSSSGPPFPVDEYVSLAGCPGKKPLPMPVARAPKDEHYGLSSTSHPNPFNPATEINYLLRNACHVELSVFNVLGQKVTTLVDEYQAAGRKTVIWPGTDAEGNRVASGVYFYRITAGDLTETRKMTLMK